MAARSFADRLAAVAALQERDVDDALRRDLTKALQAKEGLLVAKAAGIIAERLIDGLTPALRAAFDRLADGPAAQDKGCAGKRAVLDALRRTGCEDWTLYRRAAGIVQREPVYGGTVDTADELRALAALGLVEAGDPEALVRLADLLADPEPATRVGAARALGGSGRTDAAAALLRLRLLAGESHPEVIAACCEAMLLADPGSLDFVAAQLEAEDPQRVEAALLGLGQSRLDAALGVLSDWWPRTLDADLRRTAMLAIATLRQDAATRYLVTIAAEADPATAALAVEALAIFRHDNALRDRLREIVAERDEPALSAAAAWTR